MIYLALAILSSSSIAWLFKITEGGSYNRYRVTTANYGVAFFVSLLMYMCSLGNSQNNSTFSNLHLPSLLGIGIPAGLCFFLSFVFYQKSVKENGASLSGMFGKLGILLPMVVSVVLWREIPNILQSLGILLAVGAMVYVNYRPKNSDTAINQKSLIFLFLAGGMAEFSSKLFQKMGEPAEKNLFLFIVFFVAFILSYYKSLKSEAQTNTSIKRDLIAGGIVGIPNLLSSVFLISALGQIPATIAFPIYSSGAIAVISVGSYIFFKEEISSRSKWGLLMTMVAMILVNFK